MSSDPLREAASRLATSTWLRPARVPVSTYRLQLNRDFTFADARAVLPYLDALGIGDVYTSPYLKSHPESMHGYDICDHAALNPSLGDEADYAALTAELRRRDMGQIIDVVPNHMGIGSAENRWWLDVLESGQSSIFARYFDIDWRPLKVELTGKVLLPVLGEQYGRALESQSLVLRYADGGFHVAYYDRVFPISPTTAAEILRVCLARLVGEPRADRRVAELSEIVAALSRLPSNRDLNAEWAVRLHREKRAARERLRLLHDSWPDLRDAVEETLSHYGGRAGDPRSFDRLDALLQAQAYRLSFWRVASEEINYRRFFDVNDLAAIRVEDGEVFERTHWLVSELVAAGAVTGLRIDHPDGLWDPTAYFRRVQRAFVRESVGRELLATLGGEGASPESLREAAESALDGDLGDPALRPLFVVTEKILGADERLRRDWPVHGTTGYDFASAVNGIFVDSRNEREFDSLYARFIGRRDSFADIAYRNRRLIMRTALASEINVLGHRLNHLSEKDRHSRDFTLNSLTDALREVVACLPCYRTYITDAGSVTPADREAVTRAVAGAKRRNPAQDPTIFDFIRDVLLFDRLCGQTARDRAEQREFVMKFQQGTGPVVAKGVEDTAFYVYNRLVSLNEVGGDPGRFGISVATFHSLNAERRENWPDTLLCATTHDTKRGEDVRARLNVLSETPREWRSRIQRWARLNSRHRTVVDGEPAPDRNDEYLLYQTLLGVWPPAGLDGADDAAELAVRVERYLLKAIREAKTHTSWVNPNLEYEAATSHFLGGILDRSHRNPFLGELQEYARRIAEHGMTNSLAQALLRLTVPGVPDTYQGSELWELRLVDPDNRGPVDYDRRAAILAEIAAGIAARGLADVARDLLATRTDGAIKLYLIQRTLRFRRANADLFRSGDYQPLSGTGTASEHVCAFARTLGDRAVVVVAPRLVATLARGRLAPPVGPEFWTDTALVLPPGLADARWRDVLTGGEIEPTTVDGEPRLPLAGALSTLPVALLEKVSASG